MLLCSRIASSHAAQIDFFRARKAPKWQLLSFCDVRSARSDTSWSSIISIVILQYVLVRPLLVLIALVTQATKRYCYESLSPDFAPLWVTIISLLSVTIAMWGLVNFFVEMRPDLAPH